MLGHTKASMMLDTYADLFDDDDDDDEDSDGDGSLTRTQRPDLLKSGGAREIRTPDLLDANESRYQLRHSP